MTTGTVVPVSLNSAVAGAKVRLKLTHTNEHNIVLLGYANEMLSNLAAADTVEDLFLCREIIDGRAELPCHMDELVAMRLVGTGRDQWNNNVTYYRDAFPKMTGQNVNSGRHFPDMNSQGQIIGRYFVFNSDIAATHVIFSYRGRRLDENEMMMMFDYQERAVKAYIVNEWSKDNYEMVPRDVRVQRNAEWIALRGYLIGQASVRDFKLTRTQSESITSALVSNHNYQL